jgi:beta-1,2-xylosyltransferase
MFIEAKDSEAHPKPHTKLYPIFVPSKTALNGDIPVTPDARTEDIGYDPEWNRKSAKLYWVGIVAPYSRTSPADVSFSVVSQLD